MELPQSDSSKMGRNTSGFSSNFGF
jgi:hypothetical protein